MPRKKEKEIFRGFVNLSVRLPAELGEWLEEELSRLHMTKTQYVIMLVEQDRERKGGR